MTEGYIDYSGNTIVPPIYDLISDFKYEIRIVENNTSVNNLAKVQLKKNRFYIDITGKAYLQDWKNTVRLL